MIRLQFRVTRLVQCVVLMTGIFAAAQGASISLKCGSSLGHDLQFPHVSLSVDSNGFALFDSDRAFWFSPAGTPMIPWHQWVVLLPPDADLEQVTCRLENAVFEPAGTFPVHPAPPAGTWNADGEPITVWPKGRHIVDDRDVLVYSRNAYWPEETAKLRMTGRLANWKLADVAIPLYRYNPVLKTLERLVSADVIVDFEELADTIPAQGISRKSVSRKGERRVRDLVVNFDQAAAAYKKPCANNGKTKRIGIKPSMQTLPQKPLPPTSGSGYAIITTAAIRDASTKLADFMAHKTALGFNVILATETEWGGGTAQNAAINVRQWLQDNYITQDIGYALIIGNPHPSDGDVAMKMCTGDHPTDYFFCELTAEWDKDGDGIYGEHGSEASQGSETDKYFEVFAGRIPHYGNMANTDSILEKTIAYETSSNMQWRRKALLPMVPLDSNTPCYQLGEQIKGHFCEPQGTPTDRIYDEEYGLLPPPEYLRSEAFPATVWSQNAYGMLVWSTHGWAQGAAGIIDISHVAGLDDTHPAVTWQGSCGNSQPEASDNIAYSLLAHGAICTLGATRVSWYYVGQTNYTNTNSIGGMGFQFAKRIMDEQSVGQALCGLREALGFWLQNYYVFNVYGDPSVVVMPPMPPLTVSPTDPFHTSCVEEQQFNMSSRPYTICNNSTQPINWVVEASESWIDFSEVAGSLPTEGELSIDIMLKPAAASLPSGTHTATLTFTDTTNGASVERSLVLKVDPRQLACHWTLDDQVGIVSRDDSTRGFNGWLQGDCTFDAGSVPGRFGYALDFDGLDDYVETPPLDIHAGSMTVTAWIKPEVVQNVFSGIALCRGSNVQAGLYVHLDNKLKMYWGNSALLMSGIDIPVGEWSFVAMTASRDEVVLYLSDESGHFQRQKRGGHFDVESFTEGFLIGSNNKANNQYFNGAIDDVRVYNYFMEGHAIKDIFKGGITTNPLPLNRSIDVESRILRWNPGSGALAGDVYLGRKRHKVENANKASREYKGTFFGNVHYCENLLPDTEYFWRIDSETASGTIKGELWSFTTASSLLHADVRTGMLTHLTMDDVDISGDTIYDTSTLPFYDGTIIGDPTLSVVGPIHEALEFDGTDDFVTIPQMDLNTNTLTLSVWIRPVAKTYYTHTGIAFCTGNGTGAGLQIYKNNQLAYRWDGTYHKWDHGLFVPVDRWSHVAVAVGPDKATLFLNGVAVENYGAHPEEPFTQILKLGTFGSYANRRFEGCLDDFLMWNRTLSHEEVMVIYHCGLNGKSL